MVIIGIILLIVENTTTISWWVWVLIIVGILMGIIGGIILAVALSEPTVPSCYKPVVQPTCPAPQPYIQPVVQPTCPFQQPYLAPIPIVPIVKPQVPIVPSPVYSQRTELVGPETFDPDPVTTFTETPPTAVRRNVQGPYGPNNENIEVSGVHKLPGQRTYVTRDIPEHPVTSGLTNF